MSEEIQFADIVKLSFQNRHIVFIYIVTICDEINDQMPSYIHLNKQTSYK